LTTSDRAGPREANDAEITLAFDDNRLASRVFGHYDQNIAKIERKLGVVVTANGNHVVIRGEPGAAELARRVFEILYSRVKAGQEVTLGDVDGAIQEGALQGTLFPREAEEPAAAPAPSSLSASSSVSASAPLSAPAPTPSTGRGAGAAIASPSGRGGFDTIQTRKKGVVRARTPAQDVYLRALKNHELVFAEGPAGSGKTWLAVGHAVQLLERGVVERLVLSRPAVEAGERLGFLPGDMREKVDPYLRPIFDALHDFMDGRMVERGMQTGMIEVAPLAFMRGRTLANAAVLLDEAQNATSMQMKMFLTRLGEGSRMIVTGDPTQTDLPAGQTPGLSEAVRLLGKLDGVGHVRLTAEDVVRHDLVRRIVGAYEDAARSAPEPAPARPSGPRR
jgi:phosphate starvation-inducible PhoH-like protein